MSSTIIKDKLLNEISLLPEERLFEVYNFIHFFRLGAEKNKMEESIDLMKFSGAWNMDNDLFDDFLFDIAERRRQAFSGRRSNDTFID